jgi:hypothetical protein
MLHEPATPSGKDPAGPYKMRLGIWMFLFYSIFYAVFVAINLLSPQAMGAIVLLGLNLATVYGFALIIVALIQALIYDAMCRKKEAEFARLEGPSSDATPSGKASPARSTPSKATSTKIAPRKTSRKTGGKG